MASAPVACRLYSYAPFLDRAYPHLAELGVRHVEIPVPTADELDEVRRQLADHGLSATTLHGECDVQRDDTAEQIAAQLPALAALGTKLLFVSVKAEDVPLETAYGRLRAAGAAAAAGDVTIALETHPDLVTNGDVALATMQGVDHPRVRVNFDTANLYFYNQDIDAAEELQKVLPYVAAVHLKETNGEYRDWHFPALGEGIVPFGELFSILDAANYTGPYTLEIEGIEGEQRTAELVCDRIARSVAYLRQRGRL
jgi:L-ribulose-5-phosphate 3-epimerase